MTSDRGSKLPRISRAAAVTTRKVTLPVRSKKRSVWRNQAGMNATHWTANAAATRIAKAGAPPISTPRLPPAAAIRAPAPSAPTMPSQGTDFAMG